MNDDVWYFAYGSNLSTIQKELRTSAIRTGDDRPRIARLADFRFAFNKRGSKGQVFANIMACPGNQVIGVVYRCKPSTIETMSGFEVGYERRTILVVIDGNISVEAISYVAMEKNVLDDARPSDEYLTRIVDGAIQHGLPPEYIEKIKLLASASKD